MRSGSCSSLRRFNEFISAVHNLHTDKTVSAQILVHKHYILWFFSIIKLSKIVANFCQKNLFVMSEMKFSPKLCNENRQKSFWRKLRFVKSLPSLFRSRARSRRRLGWPAPGHRGPWIDFTKTKFRPKKNFQKNFLRKLWSNFNKKHVLI
jgi:hypothetical protein